MTRLDEWRAEYARYCWREVKPGRWERPSCWNGTLVVEVYDYWYAFAWLVSAAGKKTQIGMIYNTGTDAKRAATNWLKRRIGGRT